MKPYKFVAYAGLAVIAIAMMLLVSAPIRFPGSVVAWKPAVTFLSPAIVLVVLLFMRPRLASNSLLAVISLAAMPAILGTMIG